MKTTPTLLALVIVLTTGCGGSVAPDPEPESPPPGCFLGVDNLLHHRGDDAGVPVLREVPCPDAD